MSFPMDIDDQIEDALERARDKEERPLRSIVKPFIESLGARFVSDEVLEDGYRARIEREGQSAAVVVTNAQIEVLVALQLDEILNAWKQEAVDLQSKVDVLAEHIRGILRKKDFKGVKAYTGDGFAVDFTAGGETRHIHFTAAELAAHSASELAAMVEGRVNSA